MRTTSLGRSGVAVVAQSGTLPYRRLAVGWAWNLAGLPGKGSRAAEYHSAIRQTASLRYVALGTAHSEKRPRVDVLEILTLHIEVYT